ncbi:MAG: hypothetical protein IPN70_04420 [Candidatus Moraniibacteriota bacterium]|nr:MAG: hypothetical protein IPN70_04420 [Candidatus Moranbacteria bacterium]
MNIHSHSFLANIQEQALDSLRWNGFQNEANTAEYAWQHGIPYTFIKETEWKSRNPYPWHVSHLIEQANFVFKEYKKH